MGHVLKLKDGRCETVSCLRDMWELMESYMGHEARDLLQELCEEEMDRAVDEAVNMAYGPPGDLYGDAYMDYLMRQAREADDKERTTDVL